MSNTFKLVLVSPDGKKLETSCSILNVKLSNGYVGILANHLPLVGVIQTSHLNYKNDGKSYDFAISGGILNVKNNEVLVLADAFEAKNDIDLDRAIKSKERALSRLNDDSFDKQRVQASLDRAINRISVKQMELDD